MAREVTRKLNQMRKEAGMTIEDRINVHIDSESDLVKQMVEEFAGVIADGALATSVSFSCNDEVKQQSEFRAAEQDIWLGF